MSASTHGKEADFLADLAWRGLLHQITDEPELRKALNSAPITAYIGFDPTADSLHVGSLLPALNLVRLAKAGHKPIAVVGGATGMIGDPSGKTQERTLLDSAQLEKNKEGMTRQLLTLFERAGVKGRVEVVNNYDWFKDFNYLDFLRDVGKHFTVNIMLAKESVRARLEDRDHGISYTEFSYMLLQAYDFWWLYRNKGCRLQVGGSDQWGNITAGVDLIRRMLHAPADASANKDKPAYGFTFPLVTKADGSKFGKSEKGNVWLDANRTSPYEFHQFFMRAEDTEVIKFLKYFTFLSHDEVAALEKATLENPAARTAQKRLADEVTALVHGAEESEKAKAAAAALFTGGADKLSAAQLKSALAEAPSSQRAKSELAGDGVALIDVLAETGLSPSKGSARKEIAAGGIYLNDERVQDSALRIKTDDLVDGELLVLRKGKKTYHLVTYS